MIRPFQPNGSTSAVANTTSSVPGTLPDECTQVALYNTSPSAVVYWTSRIASASDADPQAVIPVVGGAKGAMPIPPNGFVRLSVGAGPKKFAVISSAADGNLLITPGVGN